MRFNPSPERDHQFRVEAERAWQALVKFITTQGSLNDWATYVDPHLGTRNKGATIPWRLIEPSSDYDNLIIVLPRSTKKQSIAGYFTWGKDNMEPGRTLAFIFLYGVSPQKGKIINPTTLLSRRTVFIHEFIHFLDHIRAKPTFSKRKRASGKQDREYYLSPVEFNAYYQQGFDAFEERFWQDTKWTPSPRHLEEGRALDEARRVLTWARIHYLYWETLAANFYRFWDPVFLAHLRSDPSMWRKFLKRVRLDFEAWKIRAEQYLRDSLGRFASTSRKNPDQDLGQLRRKALEGDSLALEKLIQGARRVGDWSLVPKKLLWDWKMEKNLQELTQGKLPEPDFEAIRYASDGSIRKHNKRWYFPNGFGAAWVWDVANPKPGLAPRLPVPVSEEMVQVNYFRFDPDPKEPRDPKKTLQYEFDLTTGLTSKFILPEQPEEDIKWNYFVDYRLNRRDPAALVRALLQIAQGEVGRSELDVLPFGQEMFE